MTRARQLDTDRGLPTPPRASAVVSSSSRSSGEGGYLIVVYDDRCEFCRRCRSWLERQTQLVPLRFLAASDPGVRAWAGELVPTGDELVVTAPSGQTWIGPDAFIACLSVLEGWTGLAARLQQPGMRGLARQLFHAASSNRHLVNRVLVDRTVSNDELAHVAATVESDSCELPMLSGDVES